MPKKLSKKSWKLIGVGVGVLIVAFIGIKFILKKRNQLPDGIASGNGRLESKLVDIAAKEPLRVKEMLANEGDLVKPGQVLVKMDTVTLESQLAEANANVQAAEQRLAAAHASITKQKSEIRLADIEVNRSRRLVQDGAGSQRDVDVRTSKAETTRASLGEADAALKTANEQVDAARAASATIQTRITDATLRSPVVGRVLYRLAEPGEVLGAGGKALTVVNLEDVYMEIFLPSEQAAQLKVGSEGRITFDFAPDRAIPGYVSFVSPEAQFTPKQVETKSEREKLMFRVKIQLPKELASEYVERIKTGVRGVGYVKYKDSAVWPDRLNHLLTSTKTADLTQ
jgi:HlyD family secretion protein